MVFIQVRIHDINVKSKKVSLRSLEVLPYEQIKWLNMKTTPELSLRY